MHVRRQISAIGIAAASLMAAVVTPASAALYCEIASSRDGFAAVRAAPDRKAKIVMRIARDLMVQLDDTRAPPAGAKDWVAVAVVRGPDNQAIGRGWLHKSLIKPDSCG